MTETPSPARRHRMPFTRLELVVLGIVEGQLCVLLGRRTEAALANHWALPGGVLRIDLDATLDDGAQRIARERLSTPLANLRQLCSVGGGGRDPRDPWTLSVVYQAFVRSDTVAVAPGKRLSALAWRSAREAATDRRLAFDHHALIGRAVAEVEAEVARLSLPDEFLPPTFTLTELQQTCEVLGGRALEKSSVIGRSRPVADLFR